jgi:two-component system, chemotaxis family, sensor kinase CheA
MEEYREIYVMEAEEMLHTMEKELLLLEQEGTDEAVQRLFRAAHTLKGSSAAMGYTLTNRLTHDMEHVLEKVRMKEWEVSAQLATLLFSCVDRIRLLHQEVADGNGESTSIDDLLDQLHRYGAVTTTARLQEPVTVRLGAEEARLARIRQEAGERLYRVAVTLSEACEMREARLAVVGQWLAGKVAFMAAQEEAEPGKASGKTPDAAWIIAAELDPDALAVEISAWVDVAEASVRECVLPGEESQTQPVANESEEAVRKARAANATIRVNVERLENLMNLVGELVIEQTRFAQVTKELNRSFASHSSVQDMGHIGDRLSRLLSELQENVMKVRMLPIEHLFNRLPRMIRDVSQSLGKDVELVLEGKETELDRTLIEELGDPLIHLIRNALDHGIEKPEERLAAGKPSTGRLRIGAHHEDNNVIIRVEDDGSGINSAKLLRKAVDSHIMTPEEAAACSPREAVDLIFHPGLSTASSVSDISGRGVGMDIVRSCIEKVNGMIEVETEPGKGTVFSIRLPLTLAIGTGLLVRICAQTYIIPMSNVAEIVRMEPGAIHMVRGMPVLYIRDKIVPVVWLHEMFGLSVPEWKGRHIPMVIIGRGEKRAAVAVEELIGNQEIVIKPLGNYVGQVEGIAGATILGSGRVALILEIGNLLKRMGRS